MAYTYVDVIVAGARGRSILTYHSKTQLERGRIVAVPVGSRRRFGVVERQVSAPSVKTRPVTSVVDLPPFPDYVVDVIQWMDDYYAAGAGTVLPLFLPARPDIASRAQPASGEALNDGAEVTLTPSQNQVLEMMLKAGGQWLLHGVTGSGKTPLYIALAQQMLARGRSTIVLVPEITLATQVITEFRKVLGNAVAITHSHMTSAQRRGVWRQARTQTEPMVIIGPRSALFTPRSDLGAIIIDEAHETSYKQEQNPRYHARDVAARMAEVTSVLMVAGSATPSAHDVYLSQQHQLQLASLPHPVHDNQRQVDIVDMRQQKGVLSPELTRALTQTLREQGQAMLFINRRGSASQVVCTGCGWVATCPECDIPQTWHGDSGALRCHWCGTHSGLPGSCPECGGMHWRFLGLGTKRIESEVVARFPHASILRWDKDSFSARDLDATMQQLRRGDIDIIIGTQMIAKGLDLPLVTLVGVVLADTMLHIPDMSSNERTYQLLHQIIGRAGRGPHSPSRVLIQTYNPGHHAITAASRQEFDRFIQTELADRQAFSYPPYSHLLKTVCKRKTRAGARKAAGRLAEHVRQTFPAAGVRGPAPAWRERVGDYYYWQLIITATDRATLLSITQTLPANWRADIDPVDLL
jgi:primosomal protein N' (replication factor Y)